jgi:hypothetical protein
MGGQSDDTEGLGLWLDGTPQYDYDDDGRETTSRLGAAVMTLATRLGMLLVIPGVAVLALMNVDHLGDFEAWLRSHSRKSARGEEADPGRPRAIRGWCGSGHAAARVNQR